MSREIKLTKDYISLVDGEDFQWLSQWKWHSHHGKQKRIYAARNGYVDGKKRIVYMHKEILSKKGYVTDHIDGDSLNNQKYNLRLATKAQDIANKDKLSTNSSGYKGVFWHKQGKKWRAVIRFNGKKISLGLFFNIEDAAKAYDKAAVKYYGEFARIQL